LRQEVREVFCSLGRGKSGKIGFVWLCFVPRDQVSIFAYVLIAYDVRSI